MYLRKDLPSFQLHHLKFPGIKYKRTAVKFDKIISAQQDFSKDINIDNIDLKRKDKPIFLDKYGRIINGHHRHKKAEKVGAQVMDAVVITSHSLEDIHAMWPEMAEVEEGTRCWKGYKKKGMKTMFGKRVPNCVKNESQENQELPPEVQQFVKSLRPDDVGKDKVGEYIVHYEGFTDECNDGHDEESIDNEYANAYRDFDSRQGQQALVRGVAHDDLGCKNNPVLYSVYKNVNENFADGKKKGKSRPGRVKRSGASCKGSVSSLRAKAKKYSGERGKMYHWCANMKAGKKKK